MLIFIALILLFNGIFVWNMVSFNEGFKLPGKKSKSKSKPKPESKEPEEPTAEVTGEPTAEDGEDDDDVAADKDLTSRIDGYKKKNK
jgi:hypothetical protein